MCLEKIQLNVYDLFIVSCVLHLFKKMGTFSPKILPQLFVFPKMNVKYPIKVLLVVGTLETGGIEKLVFDLVRRINRQQFCVEICCVRGRRGSFLDPVLELGVPVHFFGDYRKDPYSFFSKYGKFIESQQFHVVHSHMNHLSVFFLRQPCQIGVPLRIVHYHNDFHYRKRSWIQRVVLSMLGQLTNRYANKTVGISDACLESVFGPSWRQKCNTERIYNGIDLDAFSSPVDVSFLDLRTEFEIDSESLVIGHVGQFRPQKNHLFIVDLAKRLCERSPDLVFFLVGDGPMLQRVQEYVEESGLKNNFVFAGARSDVPSLLKIMDIFIYPSLWEGFGLALLEAQVAGLPVLVSENIPQEIPLTGFSQRIRLDDTDRWIESCENLILAKNEKISCMQPLPDKFRRFSVETWVNKIEVLYLSASTSG